MEYAVGTPGDDLHWRQPSCLATLWRFLGRCWRGESKAANCRRRTHFPRRSLLTARLPACPSVRLSLSVSLTLSFSTSEEPFKLDSSLLLLLLLLGAVSNSWHQSTPEGREGGRERERSFSSESNHKLWYDAIREVVT